MEVDMSSDKNKKWDRAMKMIRELNARTFFYGSGPGGIVSRPTISSKPGPDMAYAIEKGLVKLRRRWHDGTCSPGSRIGRTEVDTGITD